MVENDVLGVCSKCGGELIVDHTLHDAAQTYVWIVCDDCEDTVLVYIHPGNNKFEIKRG